MCSVLPCTPSALQADLNMQTLFRYTVGHNIRYKQVLSVSPSNTIHTVYTWLNRWQETNCNPEMERSHNMYFRSGKHWVRQIVKFVPRFANLSENGFVCEQKVSLESQESNESGHEHWVVVSMWLQQNSRLTMQAENTFRPPPPPKPPPINEH